MASEILAVPEEHLSEVIRIIRVGVALIKTPISDEIIDILFQWCEEEEAYLNAATSAGET